MAQVSTTGLMNIASDVALADGGTITATTATGVPVYIDSVYCTPIANNAAHQVGYIEVADGAVTKWIGMVEFTSTAANQGKTVRFPLGIYMSPATSVAVIYHATTNATTANAAIVWRRG